MAGSIVRTGPYAASFASTTPVSYSQRCTISTLTTGGTLATDITIPKGAVPLCVTMKCITGCDGTTPLISLGVAGTVAGYLADSAVGPAAEGVVYKGAGALMGVVVATALNLIMTTTITGPATTDCVVDIEVVYFATSMVTD